MTGTASALRCLPDGRLAVGDNVQREVADAWRSGDGAGTLALALGESVEDQGLSWLRDWGRQFMERLCQTRTYEGTATSWPEHAAKHAERVPEILGAEYVSAALLQRVWLEMLEHVRQQAVDDLEGWLQRRSGMWESVGRVTLRLVENPSDAVRPFAFIATYAERVSASGRLQQLPLARAVQTYVSKKNEAALASLMAPVRRGTECSPWLAHMVETKQLFQALAWTPSDAYQLVKEMPALREAGLVVSVPDWWKGGHPPRPTVEVTLETEAKSAVGASSMLGFDIKLCMAGDPLTKEELAKIKASESGLITLRGRWVEINREKLDQVLEHWEKIRQLHTDGTIGFLQGMRFLAGFNDKASPTQANNNVSEAAAGWSDVVAGKNLSALLARMRHPEDSGQPQSLRATLRPYQRQGLAWLWFLQNLGFGACLADDMGLGKTLQVIALLAMLKEKSMTANPSLIVCPASLIGNWAAECARFAPDLRVRVLHASALERTAIQSFEESPASSLMNVDVVITTYQMTIRSQAVPTMKWNVLVLDEAQAIKNPTTTQTQAVKKLHARARIALTGTPVENRPSDLWSLFDFLNPGLLGSASSFAQRLKSLTTTRGTDYGPVRRLVAPYILRRMKTDKTIISDLPEKIGVTARCTLTRKQATIYTRLVNELRKTLADKTTDPMQRRGQVLGFLSKFKHVCNHPSQYSGDGQFNPDDSGKFIRLTEIGSELAERQERVIVFTQFQEMCEPLALHLSQTFGRSGLILHGGTPVTHRQKLVERFQAPDGPPFFVISVKAGGTGLTLTAANHVIHFDRWWNPAVENQATDRAFRIGQKKNVLVHKFVVPGTIEEKVDRMLQDKRALSDQLLAGNSAGAEVPLTELPDDELLRLVSLDLESI